MCNARAARAATVSIVKIMLFYYDVILDVILVVGLLIFNSSSFGHQFIMKTMAAVLI